MSGSFQSLALRVGVLPTVVFYLMVLCGERLDDNCERQVTTS